MTPFKFTPDDFNPNDFLDKQSAANIANAKLELWLKSAVKVYGASGDGEPVTWYADHYGLTKNITNTHSALLIGIEKLEKKVCEHLTLQYNTNNPLNTVKCVGCGAKLKATWSEI